jgi:hypothetical protein
MSNTTRCGVDQNRLSFTEIGELIQRSPGSENDMWNCRRMNMIERLGFPGDLKGSG